LLLPQPTELVEKRRREDGTPEGPHGDVTVHGHRRRFFTVFGSPVRGVAANSSSCFALIPVRVFFPARARAKSAPAIRCCAFDFAGIAPPSRQ
jgi:hypothetical protein